MWQTTQQNVHVKDQSYDPTTYQAYLQRPRSVVTTLTYDYTYTDRVIAATGSSSPDIADAGRSVRYTILATILDAFTAAHVLEGALTTLAVDVL
ncbi:hypothetical protein E2562_009575 [Oryza meyeriana var. granulata]|uniref:Uncharacterized protein n=1 Tax=Oryza meyeriana var. granulata TaxID=110450 RepID=A0A6G1F5X5_9ORYZ|nr:hypothetical protein E2562_009575 [Oryza meyeriana var. granulata]